MHDAAQVLWERLSTLGRSALGLLPGVMLGLVAFGIFFALGRVVRGIVRRVSDSGGRHAGVGLVIGRLAQWGILVVGALLAATIVFPSFEMGDLAAIVGLSSVALGFAFREILQNFLAGILILWTRPFQLEDQIVYKEFEGTVVAIETRATFVETYDGRRVVIPNAELFVSAVTVNTANAKRRMEHELHIGLEHDPDQARAVLVASLAGLTDVLADPAPDARVVDLTADAVVLRVRWWISPPRRADVVAIRDLVLTRLRTALIEAGIRKHPAERQPASAEAGASGPPRAEVAASGPPSPAAPPPVPTSPADHGPVAATRERR